MQARLQQTERKLIDTIKKNQTLDEKLRDTQKENENICRCLETKNANTRAVEKAHNRLKLAYKQRKTQINEKTAFVKEFDKKNIKYAENYAKGAKQVQYEQREK